MSGIQVDIKGLLKQITFTSGINLKYNVNCLFLPHSGFHLSVIDPQRSKSSVTPRCLNMVIISRDELHLFCNSHPFAIYLCITPGTVNDMASQLTATAKTGRKTRGKLSSLQLKYTAPWENLRPGKEIFSKTFISRQEEIAIIS